MIHRNENICPPTSNPFLDNVLIGYLMLKPFSLKNSIDTI